MVDHRTRLEDVSNKLGWLEVDLQQTDRKSDELLLLVRELASSVNSKNDNTAIICISIPRALYNPSLSIYKGVMCFSESRYSQLIKSVSRLLTKASYAWWLGSHHLGLPSISKQRQRNPQPCGIHLHWIK